MGFKVVAGIPSYNEADTIGTVARGLDAAFESLPFAAEVVIVNADNDSPDGTAMAFENTPTRHRKVSLRTTTQGKGANLRALVEWTRTERFDALLLMDADLAYVRPSWVHGLLRPLAEGRHVAFARRPPLWNRGDLTYHLCYPLTAAVFGAGIHEPIAPTLALGRAVLDRLAAESWPAYAYQYGVDLFITSLAVDADWCEVVMDELLIHKLRSYGSNPVEQLTTGGKFREVLAAVRDLVSRRLVGPIPGSLAVNEVGAARYTYAEVTTDGDHEALAEGTARRLGDGLFFRGLPPKLVETVRPCGRWRGLSWPAWQECLIAWLQKGNGEPRPSVEQMEVLLLARVVGFYYEHIGRSDWYATVEWQAQELFAQRGRLFAPANR